MIPYIHAENSAKRYGGVPEDYLDIHRLMDSTKSCISTNKHRFLTHNSWFSTTVIPLIFGERRLNSCGKLYNTKDVAEYHILEDFRMKFIPTPQDYAEHMSLESWMNNGLGVPNRMKTAQEKSEKQEEEKTISISEALEKLKKDIENPFKNPIPPHQPYLPPYNPFDETKVID